MGCLISLIVVAFMVFGVPVSYQQQNDSVEKFVEYKEISLYTKAYHYSPNPNEAIVFIHGLGGSHQDASFLFNAQNPHMVISMDMLNHGKSGHIEQINWDNYIETVKTVVQAYHVKRVHLVGHSMGADTALMFAKQYPELVTSVILIDRGYFNFRDIVSYNITPEFLKVVEYNPNSGLDENAFHTLIEMQYTNDITKTWDINQRVLLIAANPYWLKPVEGQPSIVEMIASIKKQPENYGFTAEKVQGLPNLTLQNLNDYMNFLDEQIKAFSLKNKGFDVLKTPYNHAMIRDQEAQGVMSDYIMKYIRNDTKFLDRNK